MADGDGLMSVVRSVTPDVVRRSFALKFFLALLCIGLLVGTVGAVGTDQIRGEFEQQVHDEHATAAKQSADTVGRWHKQNIEFVETMARSQAVQNGDVDAAQDQFNYEMRARGSGADSMPNVHYVDTDNGTILASSKSGYQGNGMITLNETVVDALGTSGSTIVTEPYTSDPTLGEPQERIAYITPADTEEGYPIVYTVPLQTYTGSLSGTGDSTTIVVDGNNDVLFHQKKSGLFLQPYGEDNGAPAAAREAGPASAGWTTGGPTQGILSESSVIGGKEYVVGYSQVIDTDWVVLVHTDVDTAYGTVRSVANRGLVATFLGVAAIGAIGLVLGRNTAQSLNRLTRKTERMREGDLDVDADSERIDTVGRLYDGFAEMRDSLQDQIAEAERERKRAEVAKGEVLETNAHLQNTAAEYSEVMEQAAAGDLTARMAGDDENDAMDAIATDFNEMLAELEKTTGQLKRFADTVEESGEVVGNSAASVKDAAEQVAESIQKISDDAHTQREELEGAVEAVDAAVDALDDGDVDAAQTQLDAVASTLTDVAESTENTMAETENVAGAAEEQAAELNEVNARADDLLRYVNPLSDVLDRFETESEHEFFYPSGPGNRQESADDD